MNTKQEIIKLLKVKEYRRKYTSEQIAKILEDRGIKVSSRYVRYVANELKN